MYSQIAANKRRSLLLLVGFVVFVGVLAYVLTTAFARPGFFVPVLIFAIVYAAISYFASAKIALAMSGAQPIAKADAPELYRIVENLSIAAGLPMPQVYIMNDPSPNAFATGRDPQHAVVAVTTGILELLDKPELEGVIAHELSHVGNFDIRFMALVVALVSVVALLSDLFLRLSFWSSWGDSEEREGSNPVMLVIGIAGAVLAPLVATVVQLAISRRREYLADASGALLTRYPDGLARALAKIDQDPRGLKRANSATAPLYIANPLKGRRGGFGQALAGLFSTHPPIADRIKRLQEMEMKP
ncbi:MAG TPA: M48 family metallopeptidase [Candidatus Saccharimonadia bacterium]|nr:M48 family metallopeptidase [Candidatus Saccharimonadia bacterium]